METETLEQEFQTEDKERAAAIELQKQLAPNPGRYPLLQPLTPQQEIALLLRMLHREGYNDGITGHITYAQPDGTMLANPWELAWDEVTASDILRLDSTGRVIEGQWNITPAIGLHTLLHQRRSGIKVVIHNHSHYGSVWSALGRVPPIYDQTSGSIPEEPVMYDEYTGTVDDLDDAQAAVDALGDHPSALLKNHGVFVVANGIRQAHLRAVTLEYRCRLAWEVEAIGGGKPLLNPEEVLKMIRRGDVYGMPFYFEAMARREVRKDPSVLD